MTKRYYFHGDEEEGNSGQYFCSYCDLFVSKEHFAEEKHLGTDKERYDKEVKDWNETKAECKGKLQRPKEAHNLFSKLPNPKKSMVGAFYRWLLKQDNRDDPIGDLSRDARGDRTFPVEITSLEKLRTHLISNSACSEAIQALEEAYNEFKSNTTVRSGLPVSIRFDIFRRDAYRCQICGASVQDGARLEVDHKIPVAKGGSDEMLNLWTLCFACNRGKGVKDL